MIMRRMIQETVTYSCRTCGSIHIVRNGTNKCGSPQYHGKACGAYRVLKPVTTPKPERGQVLAAYQERVSLRGLQRLFHVGRQTVMDWLRRHMAQLPLLSETLLPVQAQDVLEVDEMGSFVAKRANKRWVWTVLCRRTRQIVAWVVGDHSEATGQRLWDAIPLPYRVCRSFSDFWRAYAAVFPAETHQQVDKASGQTAHQERWYNTVRQCLARFARQTLAFSKLDAHHELVLSWYIIEHNLRMLSSLTP